MTQFIDIESIKAVIILLFASGLLILSFRFNSKNKKKHQKIKKKNNERYYWFAYIAFLAVLPFLQAKSAKTDAEANIKSFRSVKVLRCNINANQYRVSKKEGWQVQKYFFIKNSFIIRADKCEEM